MELEPSKTTALVPVGGSVTVVDEEASSGKSQVQSLDLAPAPTSAIVLALTRRLIGERPIVEVASHLFQDLYEDEIGGKNAMSGFSYQVWHAVLEALKAHELSDDYAVVAEWKEDIAVLNSATDPTAVRLIQIKKNDSSTHWTLHQLSKSDLEEDDAPIEGTLTPPPPDAKKIYGGEISESKVTPAKAKKSKLSTLSKLYRHRRTFSTQVRNRLEFVSNARYEIKDELGVATKHVNFSLKDLSPRNLKSLESKIRVQLGIEAGEEIDFSDFELLGTDCPVANAHRYVSGRLSEMQVGKPLNLSGAGTLLAVLIMAAYVFQKAGSTARAKNLKELLRRAITRADVDKYLAAAAAASVPTKDAVLEVINRLDIEQASFHQVEKMRRQLPFVCADMMNRNGEAPVVAAYLKKLWEQKNNYENHGKVVEVLEAWHTDYLTIQQPDTKKFTREYLYCIMSMILKNASSTQQLPPVSLGSQLEDQQ